MRTNNASYSEEAEENDNSISILSINHSNFSLSLSLILFAVEIELKNLSQAKPITGGTVRQRYRCFTLKTLFTQTRAYTHFLIFFMYLHVWCMYRFPHDFVVSKASGMFYDLIGLLTFQSKLIL